MARSKTKDKILGTALGLFNNEGEVNISSVDIAAVMGISPGNLYYHYKGKDEIIRELYKDFEIEIKQVLRAKINKPLALQDNWIYLYIIFEEIFDFRFFYQNLVSVLERIPEIRPKFARLLDLKQATFSSLLKNLQEKQFVHFKSDEREILAERLSMHFTWWLAWSGLRKKYKSKKAMIDEGVYAALAQIIPYWVGDNNAYAQLLKDFLDSQEG